VGEDEVTVMWGGRFDRGPHPEMVSFTRSIETDIRLLPYDIAATKAHARVLVAAGQLDVTDLDPIDETLDDLVSEWAGGDLVPSPADEDVHSLVERVLTERVGDLGRRIHAGRSRNDLVATDLRLWTRDAASEIVDALSELVAFLCDFAEGQRDTVMPGYTHLQRAQPISMAFHVLAHGTALVRDVGRFRSAYEAADVSALGAGALAGNTLGLDPGVGATEMGFSSVFTNAMDAVSDRDFATDFLYACATTATHLSRFAEEIVLWTSAEFGFAYLSDEWSTGSSMMPQKRNPDVAELIRGRAPGVLSDLTGLLGVLKGLPLAYDRDLQEDKAFVFRSADTVLACVTAMQGLLSALRFDKGAMAAAAAGGGSWATDLAERLVTRGVPFREAHEVVGGLVAELDRRKLNLADAPAELIADAHPQLKAEDGEVADPDHSMRQRTTHGGTAPESVSAGTSALRDRLRDLTSR
jgi:argininosuccinate lyase